MKYSCHLRDRNWTIITYPLKNSQKIANLIPPNSNAEHNFIKSPCPNSIFPRQRINWPNVSSSHLFYIHVMLKGWKYRPHYHTMRSKGTAQFQKKGMRISRKINVFAFIHLTNIYSILTVCQEFYKVGYSRSLANRNLSHIKLSFSKGSCKYIWHSNLRSMDKRIRRKK